jgi:hypothetical protein
MIAGSAMRIMFGVVLVVLIVWSVSGWLKESR